MEYGLLEPAEEAGTLVLFKISTIIHVRTIQRLRRDLGVNLAGIGVILELQDRARQLELRSLGYVNETATDLNREPLACREM